MSIASKLGTAAAKKFAKKSAKAAEDAAKSAKVTKVAATTTAALGGAGIVYTGLKHLDGVINGGNNDNGGNNQGNPDEGQRKDTVIIDGGGPQGGTYYVGSDGYGEPNQQSPVIDTLFKYLPFIIGGIIIIALFALPTRSEKKKKRGSKS